MGTVSQYCMMAQDSHSVNSPSCNTGTLLLGLSATRRRRSSGLIRLTSVSSSAVPMWTAASITRRELEEAGW
jgi:hypothetical protein